MRFPIWVRGVEVERKNSSNDRMNMVNAPEYLNKTERKTKNKLGKWISRRFDRARHREKKKLITYYILWIDKYEKPNYNSILVSIFNFHSILRHVFCRQVTKWICASDDSRWWMQMRADSGWIWMLCLKNVK